MIRLVPGKIWLHRGNCTFPSFLIIIQSLRATAFRSQSVASSNLSKGNQMPFYPELGRHTPPPPPYSSGQRNCSNAIATTGASQRSDPPPPPPPTLYSTQRKECRVPSTCELEQTVASGDPYLRHSSVAIPPPAVPFQVAAAQYPSPGQPFEHHGRDQYSESILFGIPVEPNLVSSSLGHPLRPFDGLSLESRSEPVPHQSLIYDQGAGTRSEHDTFTSQSPSTVSPSQHFNYFATQLPPHGLAVDDRQPVPAYRRYPSITIPSLAYPNGLDAPASINPSGTIYPPSTFPSQQATEKHPTLTTVSSATAVPRGPHHASPALPTSPITDRTSQGHEKQRRVSQSNHRRPSVSARFEPYKRRQSNVTGENTAQLRLAGEVDNEPAKERRADSDVEVDERREEAEAGRKH